MPVVEDGQVVPQKTLSMTVSMDHYLVDAHEGLLATRYLRKLLANPKWIEHPKSVVSDLQRGWGI